MDFTPHTDAQISTMLQALGLENLADLYDRVPAQARFEPNLPPALDETGLRQQVAAASQQNQSAARGFLGGGIGPHFIPALTAALTSRGEFLTAYTPYQPEVSQGVLQAIFEYQTVIARLTGLAAANASLYDGASALAEGVLLALRKTSQNRVVVSQGVNPEYRRVLATYLAPWHSEITVLPLQSGLTAPTSVAGAGVYVLQQPNYLGSLEDPAAHAEAAHAAGALFLMVPDALGLAVLKSPGEAGADIAAGEGQPLGNPQLLGGPHFGFLAVKSELMRELPGRLVSATKDKEGRRGFVLALQAREQHIRRSKARSNITTNSQLQALAALITIVALGPAGLTELARGSVIRTHQLASMLLEIPGVELASARPFFREFALKLPRNPREVRRELANQGIAAANPLPAEYGQNLALFAASELHQGSELEALKKALTEVLA